MTFLSSVILLAENELPKTSGSDLLAVLGAVLLLATVVSLYYQILSNKRHATEREPKRRILPDPLNMRAVQDYVPLASFEKHCEKMDHNFKDVFKEIDLEGKRIDNRINALSERLSEFIGRFDETKRRP